MTRTVIREQKKIDASSVLSPRERLLLWQKARGIWKHRIPNPINELRAMRQTWSKRAPSRRP